MDNRLIFLYFVQIAKGSSLIVLLASTPFGEHVDGTGFLAFRCGVTEWEDQSVCIDWTCNA